MAKAVKKPVLPIYSVGVVWLAFALMGMLNSMWNYLFCAAASALCYAVVSALCPEKSVEVPEQPPKEERPKTTGNKEVDDLLKERQRAISEMRRLNDAIEDEKISGQIDHLEDVTGKIIDHVAQNPAKLPQI